MYKFLLIIHVLCAMLWLGGAIYERLYVHGSLKRARGTEKEIELIRIMMSTDAVFLPATLILLATGIIMTVMSGAGFYTMTWLGFKQIVMTGILLIFLFYGGPIRNRFKKGFQEVLNGERGITVEDRERLRSLFIAADFVHLGVILNAVMAIWRPF
jgi:uncharacterized membrane protein